MIEMFPKWKEKTYLFPGDEDEQFGIKSEWVERNVFFQVVESKNSFIVEAVFDNNENGECETVNTFTHSTDYSDYDSTLNKAEEFVKQITEALLHYRKHPVIEPAGFYPEPVILKVVCKDCTWGIDYSIFELDLQEVEIKQTILLSDIYVEEQKRVYTDSEQNFKNFEELLNYIITQGITLTKDESIKTINNWYNSFN